MGDRGDRCGYIIDRKRGKPLASDMGKDSAAV